MALGASAILDIVAPQFATDPNKSDFITLATGRTNINFYGDNANLAIALRAAHMMTLRDLGEAGGTGGGELASKREGDLALSFHKGSQSDSDGDLALTSYGRQLQGLTRGSGAFIGVTGGNDSGYAS